MSLARAAADMADELENERITIELFPAPRPMFHGHMIRMATGQNPAWYRRLAGTIPPRHRTLTRCTTGIRRSMILGALRRIAAGCPRGSSWEAVVMPIVRYRSCTVDA